jgi:demethylmenaquinone methyltransferase / 2-methoxy-6-polyprenyl-1,4-benzoquinol methylase
MKPSAPLPTGVEKARAVQQMFDAIASRYDLVNRVMTFGMDVGWRRRAVASLGLSSGALVYDLACGTGDFCRELSTMRMKPVGFDFSFQMLHAAKTEAALVQADALRLPVADASAEGITCGFALRNVSDLQALFVEMARVLRPQARIALLEVGTPQGRVRRFGHRVYFNKVVPLIGGALSDRAAYRYLPRSVAYLPPDDELIAMIERAGFRDVARIRLSLGAAQLIVGTRA